MGEPATITVTYTDGSGIFSGTSEEWGDGVGTSSLQEGRCSATAEPAGSLSDSYQATHRWTEPGTYSLVLGVNTYTCRGDDRCPGEVDHDADREGARPLGLEAEGLGRRAEDRPRAAGEVEVAEARASSHSW